MVDEQINQSQYWSAQNTSINLEKMYNDFISEIDSIRSYVNIADNKGLLSNLKENTFSKIIGSVKVSDSPQESRCHAFYRLIGLPIVSDINSTFFNPGFDIDSNKNPDKMTNKFQIIKNISEEMYDFFLKREEYYSRFVSSTFAKQDLYAGLIAMTAYNVGYRKFSDPLKTLDVFDTDNSSQVFVPILKDSNDTLIGEYNVSGSSVLSKLRGHCIKPIMVDPRIDLTVMPSKNKIAVPFVSDKSKTKIAENIFVKRPLLEKVIRDRFSVSDQESKVGEKNQDFILYLKSIDSIQDFSIIQDIYKNNVFRLDEQNAFKNFFFIANSLMVEIVKAQHDIQSAQSLYSWIPIPNSKGPEYGSTTASVFSNINDNLKTLNDKYIIELSARYSLDQALAGIETVDATSENFAFQAISSPFDTNKSSSESIQSTIKKSLDSATQTRYDICKKANDALRTIEIITGEFSGFGLIDIIVIYNSLYIMDKSSLLGLLDDDAYNRAKEIMDELSLREEFNLSRNEIFASLSDLNKTIKNLYDIVDKLYTDVSNNLFAS